MRFDFPSWILMSYDDESFDKNHRKTTLSSYFILRFPVGHRRAVAVKSAWKHSKKNPSFKPYFLPFQKNNNMNLHMRWTGWNTVWQKIWLNERCHATWFTTLPGFAAASYCFLNRSRKVSRISKPPWIQKFIDRSHNLACLRDFFAAVPWMATGQNFMKSLLPVFTIMTI